MIYKAYIVQKGEGCDYTIACGKRMLNLQATTWDSALIELKNIIKEEYTADWELQSAELFEISKSVSLDTERIYDDLAWAKQQDEDVTREAIEREEYNRLKAKYEK